MISQTLQLHFDNQFSFGDIDEKFAKIMEFIAPEHLDRFREFRNQLLGVLAENPDSQEIVSNNLDKGIEEFKTINTNLSNRNKNATIIASEVISEEKLKEYSKSRKR